MPTTSKRFYITRADDHAVITSVPVQKTVCAAPPRVEFGAANEPSTSTAESAMQVEHRPESRDAALSGRAAGRFHRPHLPYIGRSGR